MSISIPPPSPIPPPTTTSSIRRSNITSLKVYLLTLSITTTTLLTTVFYLTYGILTSLLTLITFITLLSCCYYLLAVSALTKYNIVEYICYPRYYMVWSEERRFRVDNVREGGLFKLLKDYTLTLEKEHMIPVRAATFTTASSSSNTTSCTSTVDYSLSSFGSTNSSSRSSSCLEEIYLELGNCSTTAAATSTTTALGTKEEEEEEDDQNAHDNMTSEYDACSTAKVDNTSSATASSSSSDNIATEEAEKDDEDASSSKCVTDDCSTHIRIPCHPAAAAKNDAYSTKTRTRTRDVPINCPICLSTYQPSDSICYSPNYPKCSHVFHQSCIIKWFVEVGRHDSTIVIGHCDSLLSKKKKEKSRLNDEEYLLGYRLECPCCRQVFVGGDEVCETKEDKDDADDSEEEEGIDDDRSKERTMVAIERVLEKEEKEDGVNEEEQLFDEEKGIPEAKAKTTVSVLPQ